MKNWNAAKCSISCFVSKQIKKLNKQFSLQKFYFSEWRLLTGKTPDSDTLLEAGQTLAQTSSALAHLSPKIWDKYITRIISSRKKNWTQLLGGNKKKKGEIDFDFSNKWLCSGLKCNKKWKSM